MQLSKNQCHLFMIAKLLNIEHLSCKNIYAEVTQERKIILKINDRMAM